MKRFVGIFSLILVIGLALFIYWKYFFTYSTGYRSGLLQKFSHKGTIFKTYEGEMILSSIRSNANVALASEKFLFSVTNEQIAKQMELLQGRMVTVHYNNKNGTLPWRGESAYIVDSVKLEELP
ncbi:hypothetical protein PDL71_16430 [Lacibacter sp. MH-610]|uniref:hypothetical protein n=1 Tax=Lacibacter sp. MH-610 TaxID=3020883 RepID=UPI00389250B0